jgi:hypothetical protein
MESLAINRVSQRGRLLIRSDLTDWPPQGANFMLEYKRWRTVIGRAAFCHETSLLKLPVPTLTRMGIGA